MRYIRQIIMLAVLAFAGMAGSLSFLLFTPGPEDGGTLWTGLPQRAEAVFTSMHSEKEEEGDPGESEAYWAMIDRILAYEERYQVDSARYDGMTAEEAIQALEEEYGVLEEGGGRTEETEKAWE